MALAGASAWFVERVANCLPSRQSRLLRRALKHLGPTRLSDVEDAQQALVDLAVELNLADCKNLASERASLAAA